jgi:hypothetical protein
MISISDKCGGLLRVKFKIIFVFGCYFIWLMVVLFYFFIYICNRE